MVKHSRIGSILVLALHMFGCSQIQVSQNKARAEKVLPVSLAQEANKDAFDPLAGEEARYHFDLSKNFFPTPAAERKARASLEAEAKRLDSISIGAAHSSRQLLEGFQLSDAIMRDLGKHQAYLSLRYYADVRDADALADANALGSKVGDHLSLFPSIVAGFPEATLDRF